MNEKKTEAGTCQGFDLNTLTEAGVKGKHFIPKSLHPLPIPLCPNQFSGSLCSNLGGHTYGTR